MSKPLPLRYILPAALSVAATIPVPTTAQEAPGEKPAKCMVWRFQGEKATVYIAGSIHVLRESDYPLPSPYRAAYEDSSLLTFEIKPEEINSPETGKKMLAAGTLPEGETVHDHLSEEAAKAVDTFLAESGVPATLTKFRPWMFSLTVAMIETMKLGAVPQFGVDHVYGEKAAKDKKKTDGLEDVATQVSLFADLPKDAQEQMLKKTLADLPELGTQFKRMHEAWQAGDTQALYEQVFEDADEFPEFMESLLLKRNRNWIDQIVGYIEGEENVMVIVGAAHLAGEGSVIDLLEKKGFKGEQLSYIPAKKAEKVAPPLKK